MTTIPPENSTTAIVYPRKIDIALYTLLTVLAGGAWAYVGLGMAGAVAILPAGDLGPGMGLFSLLGVEVDNSLSRWLSVICQPRADGAITWPAYGFAVLMWFAGAVAMMLPSAAPMLARHYRLTARRACLPRPTDDHGLRLLPLTVGYLLVWALFAAAAAGLQIWLGQHALIADGLLISHDGLAGVILIAAGFYQFSRTKNACMRRCRVRFPLKKDAAFDRQAQAQDHVKSQVEHQMLAALRAGIGHGLDCLGCCWALMLTMFTLGLMNIVWMIAMAIIAIIEKTLPSVRFTQFVGICLLAAGALILVA